MLLSVDLDVMFDGLEAVIRDFSEHQIMFL